MDRVVCYLALGLALTALLSSGELHARKRGSGSSPHDTEQDSSGGRIRFGKGLSRGAKYSGPTLSRQQLAVCVQMQERVNSAFAKLDRDEALLKQQEAAVDPYSQVSVDNFNSLVSAFNADGERANAGVDQFNKACADRAYYESDMQAVRRELAK